MENDMTLACREFYNELSDYEKKGVDISVKEIPASPLQVINAHIIREEIIYMRDYEFDEKGDIKRLCFHPVRKK